MTKKKTTTTETAIKEETPKVAVEISKTEVAGPESEAKQRFRQLIEVYKRNSPAKYELKKSELEDKLNKIK
jgi:hypothetical protein